MAANTAINIGEQALDVPDHLVVSHSTVPPSVRMTLPTAEAHELQADDELNQPIVTSASDSLEPATMTLSTAAELGLQAHDVPTEPVAISRHTFDSKNPTKLPMEIIGGLTVRMIRRRGELTLEQRQWVFDILQSLSKIGTVTKEVEKMIQIKFILRAIMGEAEKAKAPYSFPDPFPTDAAIILAKVEDDLGFEEEIEPASTPSPPPPAASSSKKRKRKAPTPCASVSRQPIDFNNPTIAKLMRNITQSVTNGRRSLKIADRALKVESNIIGGNGLQVGDWWPYRICALNDGAHGASQAGIAGGAVSGTFSIVVSRAYENMDQDKGDGILYSGSNAHDNKDKVTPVLTYATKGMRLAHLKRRSIRVLRTAGSPWRGAPSVGIRYDGLYTIMEELILQNAKGGAYIAFKLKRNAGQLEINTSRPNQAEKNAFEQMKRSI